MINNTKWAELDLIALLEIIPMFTPCSCNIAFNICASVSLSTQKIIKMASNSVKYLLNTFLNTWLVKGHWSKGASHENAYLSAAGEKKMKVKLIIFS